MFKWLAKLIHGKHIGKYIYYEGMRLEIIDVNLFTFEAKTPGAFVYFTTTFPYRFLKEATDGTT